MKGFPNNRFSLFSQIAIGSFCLFLLPLLGHSLIKPELSHWMTLLICGGFLSMVVAIFIAGQWNSALCELRNTVASIGAQEFKGPSGNYPHEMRFLVQSVRGTQVELQKKLESLSHDEAQLRSILSSMVEGVVAIDENDGILYHNEPASHLLGQSGETLSGKKIWQFTELRDLRGVLESVRVLGKPVGKEVVLRFENKKTVLSVQGTPFKSALVHGVILVFHDVTDLRRLEGVRRDFVANVSHELKTPLTSIRGYVETLMEGALNDSKNNVRFLEKIQKNVHQLSELVRDLLQLGEIESEEKKTALSPVELNPLVSEVLGQYEFEVAKKHHQCRNDLENESIQVIAEAESVSRIISNLVSNAIRYTPQGGAILVRTFRRDKMGCFEITDTGVGISEKELPRIFERFYRVDKARSRDVGGTGLGLAIVKHLVQAASGEIRVESRVGGGSKFTVKFPLVNHA